MPNTSKHYVVIRLSAMGDVALIVPVIKAVCTQNDNIHLHLITRKVFHPLFQGIPNLSFIEPDLYGKHQGVLGLYQLFKEVWKALPKIEAYLDLHAVLRSKTLQFYFKMSGVQCFSIDKGRKEKKALTRRENKIRKALKHSSERYAEVFRKAGLKADLSQFTPLQIEPSSTVQQFLKTFEKPVIGIAPFAQHKEKMYPLAQIEKVIKKLSTDFEIVLFGGGEEEAEKAKNLTNKFSNVHSAIGRFDSLAEELSLINEMKWMLTMDSSNMHLARLVGVKVYSIWGATHPDAGFWPFDQKDESTFIQIDPKELTCRPCSVYGNKTCFRGDWACLTRLDPERIVEQICQQEA